MSAPFHPGELRAQALAGVVANGAAIRTSMPDQHRDFFAALPFLFAATRADDGSPRAQVLTGDPGFIDSPDATTLRIRAPWQVAAGDPVGLLGLDFSNRRRNRANGIVRANTAGVVTLDVHQSFGNCPRHIHLRHVQAAPRAPQPAQTFKGLHQRAMIAAADTFFIASSGGQYGVDMSHRGGPRGFVTIEDDTLLIPDYDGNRYFNTLGNLLLDPRAALLFVDVENGDVLELWGSADIVWHARQRYWRFAVEGGSIQAAALPLRWTEVHD